MVGRQLRDFPVKAAEQWQACSRVRRDGGAGIDSFFFPLRQGCRNRYCSSPSFVWFPVKELHFQSRNLSSSLERC